MPAVPAAAVLLAAGGVFGDTGGLLQGLMLAMGGALFVGNVLAVVRPPRRGRVGSLQRAPLVRTLLMALLGLLISLWALASMLR